MNDKIITFGCRLNFSESQIIADHIKKLNLENDVIVVHSCSVTKNADKESMDKVRELIKNNHSNKKIFVTGCSAQLDPEKYLALGADRVIGNEDKLKIESYNLDPDPSGNLTKNKIWSDLSGLKRIENLPKTTVIEGRTRGLIQIQNGCDHDCTFCVIYKARGKNRSVPLTDIFEQIRILVENSYQEIVFTGVDITDYGKDFDNDLTLAKLIKKTLSLFPQISRLRLSSIDVAEIDDELFQLIASEPRIMPYIHISMQSGSDLILKRMKRRHLASDIRTFCLNLLQLRPEVVFGADIIAGFPTETEELFQETANLLQSEIPNFVHLHIFPFSAHSGTPAARMPQVNGKIIKERAKILRNIHHNNKLKFFENILNSENTISNVLYETKNIGKTSQFFKVKLINNNVNEQNIVGKVLKTRLLSLEKDSKNFLNPFYFSGELIF